MSRLTLTAPHGPQMHDPVRSAPARWASAPWKVAAERSAPEPLAGTLRLTATVVTLTLAVVLIIAVLVDLSLAEQTHAWLGYQFRGLPARPNVALGIFVHNARAILGVFGLLLMAQLAAHHRGGAGVAQRLILAGGELILTGVIAANALVVGAGLGAYGFRMARAELPHGPVELAAYALALALYLQGRRRALSISHLARVVAASFALLGLAAALETFVNV